DVSEMNFQAFTAGGRTFTNLDTAEKYLAARALPVMIKADHSEIGEEIFSDRYLALDGLRRLFGSKPVKGVSNGVVIEDLLSGPRVVLSAFTDGSNAVPLLATRLYDRVDDGDGGMQAAGVGAHTGTSQYAQQLTRYLDEKFIQPLVAGLAADSIPCWGIISIDCIITEAGPRLTAIRCAMNPGEAEAVLPRSEDDLLPWTEAMITRRLFEMPAPAWAATPSVAIGLMARGYPSFFPYGGTINGLTEIDEGVLVFHNTTANPAAILPYTPRYHRGGALGSMLGGILGIGSGSGAILHTTGGQPLTVVTQAATLTSARGRALINAERIQFDGRTFRSDIGTREFN
ncbi:MAG TPA: phosphoribosylglycinamide synthetase C domain-containing protein, partial [Roseiflexaceae bacterium]|nr:phosphoribosylglycinamide synthetase C domain-containing protein [Roseiflexaceae bacterium]